jgi:hypothetical protein
MTPAFCGSAAGPALSWRPVVPGKEVEAGTLGLPIPQLCSTNLLSGSEAALAVPVACLIGWLL